MCRFIQIFKSELLPIYWTYTNTNVPMSRVFTCSGAKFKCATTLSKLQDVCQNASIAPSMYIHICKTSLNELNTLHTHRYVCNPVHVSCSLYVCLCVKEISDLQVGKSVDVKTNRSNQIVFLTLIKIVFPLFMYAYFYAKQQHPGCKKCQTKQKQYCKWVHI